ncbi:MAG: DUF3782 domain-containing protein [Candidatus Bathyarchaeota archaeon]
MSLKEEFLSLIEKDKEFRYAVAGLLGLEEILRRLDRHEDRLVKIWEEIKSLREEQKKLGEEQVRLREDMNKLREDMLLGFKRHDEEIAKLREDMLLGFKTHDEILKRHGEEIAKLREDMVAGFKRHDEILEKHAQEIAKLREDMLLGFKRHDEILEKHAQEIAKLREDMVAGFKRHDEVIAKLREDMNRGFMFVERHISALGARWGLMSEEAFREGIRQLVEKEFGFKVEKWVGFDEKGVVFGYPSQVDIDVAIHNQKIILVEVKSHVRASDVAAFKRKAELYSKVEGKKPSRLLIVTPYVEEKAVEAAKHFNIEIYTKV